MIAVVSRVVAQDLLGGDPAALAGEVGVHDRQVGPGTSPVARQRGRHAGEPVGDRGERRACRRPRRSGGGRASSRCVAERPAARLVVRQDRVDAERVPADDRHPAAEALEGGQLGLGLGLDARVVVARPGDDDDADPLGDEVADLPQLGLRVAPGVADLHQQPLLAGDLDDPAGDLGEVRVVHLVDDQARRWSWRRRPGCARTGSRRSPSSRETCRTRLATSSLTPSRPASAREAVASETPARSATSTSRNLGPGLGIRSLPGNIDRTRCYCQWRSATALEYVSAFVSAFVPAAKERRGMTEPSIQAHAVGHGPGRDA